MDNHHAVVLSDTRLSTENTRPIMAPVFCTTMSTLVTLGEVLSKFAKTIASAALVFLGSDACIRILLRNNTCLVTPSHAPRFSSVGPDSLET